jgi:hypothetical protein
VDLSIFNIQGQKIMTLVDEKQMPGEHTVRFGASLLPDGIYIIRLQVHDASVLQKLVVTH